MPWSLDIWIDRSLDPWTSKRPAISSFGRPGGPRSGRFPAWASRPREGGKAGTPFGRVHILRRLSSHDVWLRGVVLLESLLGEIPGQVTTAGRDYDGRDQDATDEGSAPAAVVRPPAPVPVRPTFRVRRTGHPPAVSGRRARPIVNKGRGPSAWNRLESPILTLDCRNRAPIARRQRVFRSSIRNNLSRNAPTRSPMSDSS